MHSILTHSSRLLAATALFCTALHAAPTSQIVLDMPPTPQHPRNSEGAFAALQSGRIEFVYTQFNGGSDDSSPAQLAEVHSDDQGLTWSGPRVWVENGKNLNVMSVSLLRLASGKLAMFYLIKRSRVDCRPYMTVSTDEGKSWSSPRLVFDAPGYFVLNNDRVVQTRQGRLILPVSFHRARNGADADESIDERGLCLWYYSEDDGATWREADTWWALPMPSRDGLQELGVVELADGSLYSWARTDVGEQFEFRSPDAGKTWSAPKATELYSPCSPASIKRLPHSRALLAIYNDRPSRPDLPPTTTTRARWRLVSAISHDDGRTWQNPKLLEEQMGREFTYTAIHFVGDAVLLCYRIGEVSESNDELGRVAQRIRRIDLSWLLAP